MTVNRSSISFAGDDHSPGGLSVDPGPLNLFDLLGLADDIDGFARRRAVEIKHGRIAMMAFVDMAVPELGITFPWSLDLARTYPFADVLKDGIGFAALTNVPLSVLAQIVIFAGFAESGVMPSSQYTGGHQDLPASFDGSSGTISGGYTFTTKIEDPDERDRKLNIKEYSAPCATHN